jgi:lysophospholipase L1-like esterase
MVRVKGNGNVAAEYLALGDSYTIGEGVEDDARWPVQLAAELRARGIAIAHPHLIARSGWSTDELDAAIDEELAHGQLQGTYGLVSLPIGVNNQYRGRSAEDFGNEFSYLLSRAIAFAAGDPAHVLVVSIPDWGGTPYARAANRDPGQVAREIDAFNAEARRACETRGVAFVDITDLSRDPAHADWLVADGLHPSAPMYRLWTERIANAIP